jgi:hypothetical protein
MDNQHRKLDQAEIELMNEIESHGRALGRLIHNLRNTNKTDQRWVSIGATDLQTGLMALTRSVTKPDFF